jgi:hypothetical protein
MRSSDCASCIAPSALFLGRGLVATMIGGPTLACAQSSVRSCGELLTGRNGAAADTISQRRVAEEAGMATTDTQPCWQITGTPGRGYA